MDEGKELPHPFVADDGERRGIHAADFNFADGHIVASLAFLNCIMTAAKEKYSRGAWLYLGKKRIDAKGGRNMTFSELKKKDMICIGDGRVIGRACDVVLDRRRAGARPDRLRGMRHFSKREKPDGDSVAADRLHRRRRDSGFAGELLKGVYLFSEYGYNKRMGKCKIFQNEG